MTGSALTRWTLRDSAGGLDRGGSLREGSGSPVLADRDLADFGFSGTPQLKRSFSLSKVVTRWFQVLNLPPVYDAQQTHRHCFPL